MSRSSKWKLEQTKTKVVFRLQFHATHVPHTGWDKLFISFISADTGKPTAKTTKANVRNGTCKWPDPIYETTRLLQNSQSKQYEEKLYKIIVAMGSSRASILGETTINLADFVDPLMPSLVALPLLGCSYGTVLHVTVQLLTSKTGFREFEQQRELRERVLDPGINSHSHKTGVLDEVSIRTKSKLDSAELSSIDEDASDSAIGFDGSSSTSESLGTEKPESSVRHESIVSDNLNPLGHYRSLHAVKGDTSDDQNSFRESSGSAQLWPLENSTDDNSGVVFEENRLRESLALAESSSLSLKLEVGSLQRLADELDAETQKFSHLLAAEFSASEDLTKAVAILKSDYFQLKDDMSKLKNLRPSHTKNNGNQVDFCDPSIKAQFERGVAAVEGKIKELLRKIYHGHLHGDTKSICMELEALLNFLLDFSLEGGLISETEDANETRKLIISNNGQFSSCDVLGSDLCRPETLHQESEIVDTAATLEAMKSQILDIVRELDEAKVEKEDLVRKMDQMECYYEGLVQELEETQKRLMGELQHLRNEQSTSLYALSAVEAENESLRQEINQQMQQFAEERRDLDDLNKELERRATVSETALRRARLNYTVAVDKLQKDLELLSSQVVSMFETNESLIKTALPLQHEVENNLLHNPEDDDHVQKITPFKRKSAGGDILFEDLKRSFCLQEELYKKVEEELISVSFVSLDLDIYSKALEESLREADILIRNMKEKTAELVEELEVSTTSQNQLMLRMQQASEDIHALNDFKASSISRCADLAQQNQLLEKKVVSISKENYVLVQKLNDQENMMTEYSSYKNKYEACLAENAELSIHLKHELLEKEKLLNDMSVLEVNIETLKLESDKLASLKESLEESISFTENKLADLLESYNQQFRHVETSPSPITESEDEKDAIFQLGKVQQDAFLKNSQLLKENQVLRSERDTADSSLMALRTEFQVLKQLFKSNAQDTVMRLGASDALVATFQIKLESVAKKLQLNAELENEYIEQSKNLLADLSNTQNVLQELTCENGYLDQAYAGIDALERELGRSKQIIVELMDNKQELDVALLDKSEESFKLSCEIICLKEKLNSLLDGFHAEKNLGIELERRAMDLTSELNECRDKFLIYARQNDELTHARELVSDLEQEKSRLTHVLSQQNEELETKNSHQDSLESWLSELLDHSLATDVTQAYVASQYESQHTELKRRLCHSEVCLSELQRKYDETEVMLNQYLINEASRETGNTEASTSLDESLSAVDSESLKSMMKDAEEQIVSFAASKEELEILVMILREKLDETSAELGFSNELKDELVELRTRCNELSYKLSEQVIKTEEFRNLSIHLREVKDKAEAEHLAAHQKRETEVPAASSQDTLRVAFMKEQYETRIQELKQQLAISKKHGEEMLLKLQDAIDELENRKRSEAMSLKRNEELCHRLASLDGELQSAIVEKREKGKLHDRMKAELECALLSLECCKEEREKLEARVHEFEVLNSQLAVELSSVKQKLDDLKSDHVLETELKQDTSVGPAEKENAGGTILVSGPAQDSTHRGMHQTPGTLVTQQLAQSSTENPDVIIKDPGVLQLKSCFEHLYEELERMKNENTDDSVDHDAEDSAPGVPEREMAQLNRANELLRSTFPLSGDIPVGGNPLEKILCYEIELIEALKAKSNQNLQMQRDDEGIIRSFRDINVLINEFLQLKSRHASMEADLREMHERYSQLSLRLAEVEGERQKLEMTLKTLRATRRIATLKRASPANLATNLS